MTKKIKFIRSRERDGGQIVLEANDGNDHILKKEIEQVKKSIAKPIDKSKVKYEGSFWKSNAKVVTEAYPFSRIPRYSHPEALYEIAKEYFIECDNRPLKEGKRTETEKDSGFEVKQDFIDKKQVYTLISFLNYAGISNTNWFEKYKKNPAFETVIEFIERTIADDKFKGAVAGLYNSSIISKDLGLSDSVKVKKDDDDNSRTFDVTKIDDDTLDQLLTILKLHSDEQNGDIIDVT